MDEFKALVVDDERNITELISAALKIEGFQVDQCVRGYDALKKMESKDFDIVILDIMLPDLDGFSVCEKARLEGIKVPILFLTARDATEDRVRGLSSGGDDYVPKPFSVEELTARVKAILRRTRPHLTEGKLEFADLMLDEQTYEVSRNDQPIELTATEFNLLRFLLKNAKRVVTKNQILNAVWLDPADRDINLVETYISYLRKKIDNIDPPLIHTVRGVGYVLRLPR